MYYLQGSSLYRVGQSSAIQQNIDSLQGSNGAVYYLQGTTLDELGQGAVAQYVYSFSLDGSGNVYTYQGTYQTNGLFCENGTPFAQAVSAPPRTVFTKSAC